MPTPLYALRLRLILTFAALLLAGAPFARAAQPAGDRIELPTDYATLAEAVEHSKAGDTIFMASGRYHAENVAVRHPLRIIGESASHVIVDGSPPGGLALITLSGDVRIDQVTFRNKVRPFSSPRVEIRECLLFMPIFFSGIDCRLEGCVVIVSEGEPVEYIARWDTHALAVAFVDSGGMMVNNLILRAESDPVGVLEGDQPPFVTPTPTIRCSDPRFCPSGPGAGFAPSMDAILPLGNCQIMHNTIVNVRGGNTGYLTYEMLSDFAALLPGMGAGIRVALPEGMTISNNIFWNIQGGRPLYPNYDGMWMPSGSSTGIYMLRVDPHESLTIENNLFYDMDYGIVADQPTLPPGVVIRNNVWAAPGFVNPASDDYRLLPGSPAIDSGTAVAWLTQDQDGNPRPVNFGWDIGAFEYQNLLSDLNQDGRVDALDLNIFISQWGLELPKMKAAGGREPVELITVIPGQPTPTPRRTPALTPTPPR